MMSRRETWLWGIAGVALFLALWHVSAVGSRSSLMPTPWQVALGLEELWEKGRLARYVVASLFRVTIGFGGAVAVGIPLGLMMGWFARAHALLNPLVQMLRPISPIAWTPLAILWFMVSDRASIFLIFYASLFPITTATIAAVRNIPLVHVRAAENFGIRGLSLFTSILLPAALPQIIIGLRIALGVAWVVIVAAEMIASMSGLGYLIIDGRNNTRYDLVVAGMVLIGVIGLILDWLIRRLETLAAVRWGFLQQRK